MKKDLAIIGSGISGLSAACHARKRGYNVTVYEKHSSPGGRVRSFEDKGFVFDKGPSWYWMPDVFEKFFAQFGKDVNKELNLVRLDPSYKVFFEKHDYDIPANYEELKALFESIEPGSGKNLDKFLADAEYKYSVGMDKLVYQPSLSPMEFIKADVISGLFKLNLLSPITKLTTKYFKNPELLELLHFPVLFLGAKPEDTPALYSLMNYADIKLGTWYPMGGMDQISAAFYKLALELGVKFQFNANVQKIKCENGKAKSILVNGDCIDHEQIIAAADYHFVDQKLLDEPYRSYTHEYWEKRQMSPSSLLYYVGINKKVEGLEHHNLFFDTDFNKHAATIYDDIEWPEDPLFYVCCPSKTDDTVAPEGKENMFILVPIAPGVKDIDDATKNSYFNQIVERIESRTKQNIKDHVEVKHCYSVNDFKTEYNSFKGNAYGLANTLRQTAFLKPKMKSKKLSNLYFAGQLTVPGPGLPPSIISGQVAAELLP